MVKVDAIIVGNGIFARVAAHLMAINRIFGSAIMIASDAFPTASVQNQAWLQSGLIYPLSDTEGLKDAEACIMHGWRLQGLRLKSMIERYGIMAVRNEEEARMKLAFLTKHGYPEYKEILSRAEVEQELGKDFSKSSGFTADTCFIKTPDQPFDEGGLLGWCDNSILSPGSGFRIIAGEAILKRSFIARHGYSVVVNGIEFDPDYLFVMAGVNTVRFLMPLGIHEKLDISARRCVLMRAPLVTDLKADLFMDSISHLNVNQVTNRRNEKMCLLGDILYSPVPDLTKELTGRAVTAEDKVKFLENFCKQEYYPQLRTRLLPFVKDDRNFSVCYKTERNGHLPWLYESSEFAPQFSNIYVGGPGKATLAWYAAQLLLNRAKINIQPEVKRPITSGQPSYQSVWFDH